MLTKVKAVLRHQILFLVSVAYSKVVMVEVTIECQVWCNVPFKRAAEKCENGITKYDAV